MLAILATFATSLLIMPHEEKSFVSWMRSNNLLFTGDEYYFRLGIYLSNSRYVANFRGSYKVSLNKFACHTPAEIKSLLTLQYETGSDATNVKSTVKAPESLDWREKGAVAPVQDQAQCGSCWAFSAIAGAEGAWVVAGNKLLKLSEQNLVDCVQTCQGCSGGLRDKAYEWVKDHQGGKFMLEDDYPYTALDENCKWDETKGAASVSGYVKIKVADEDDLADKVTQYGPTSVGIDASGYGFSLYSGGIYDDNSCSASYINHGVCCVGFGSEDGKNYFIVKNSWGASWGESGFIRFLRGKDLCGISSRAYSCIA